MRFNDFKVIAEAQFNSKQEVIDHFVKQGKSAAAGASAWERGWRGSAPKKKETPRPPVRSYHDDLDDKRYGETNEGKDPCWDDYKRKPGTKKYAPGSCVKKEGIEALEQALAEAAIGINPKRPARSGSRPSRGHEPVPRYKDHISPSGVKTNMPPSDDDYAINYGKNGLVAKDRKARGVDVATGKDTVDESVMSEIDMRIDDLLGDLAEKHGSEYLANHLEAAARTVAKKLAKEYNVSSAEILPTVKEKCNLNEHRKGYRAKKYPRKPINTIGPRKPKKAKKHFESVEGLEAQLEEARLALEGVQVCEFCGSSDHTSLDEAGKASRSLCVSSKPDSELGASQLSSCKAQGLRARDGEKSHKIGKTRTRVGGKRIKGKKYGGPLPDWS